MSATQEKWGWGAALVLGEESPGGGVDETAVAGCGAVSGFLLSIFLHRMLVRIFYLKKIRTSYFARILTSDENPNVVFCPYFDFRRESERRILPVF